jgi:hypothetical protein
VYGAPEGTLLVANEHSYSSAWSCKTGKRIESSWTSIRGRNSPPMGAKIIQIFFARFARARRKREGGRKKEGRRGKEKIKF